MTSPLEQTHRDVVTALILLGGSADAVTLKKHLIGAGYEKLNAELAIQRSTDQRQLPIVKIARDFRIVLEDDLPEQCAEILQWRKSGIYSGYILEAHGRKCVQDRLCNEDEGIRVAEDRCVKKALERIAGERA